MRSINPSSRSTQRRSACAFSKSISLDEIVRAKSKDKATDESEVDSMLLDDDDVPPSRTKRSTPAPRATRAAKAGAQTSKAKAAPKARGKKALLMKTKMKTKTKTKLCSSTMMRKKKKKREAEAEEI
jgi:hypothetical protein